MDRETAGSSVQAPSSGPDGSAGGGDARGEAPRLVSPDQAALLAILAGVTVVLVAYVFHQAFGVAVLWAVGWGIVAGGFIFFTNRMFVKRIGREEEARRPMIDIFGVMGLAVVVGVILSTAITLQLLGDDVHAEQEQRRRDTLAPRKEEISKLEQDEMKLQNAVVNPVRPNVDEDPTVSPFLKDYNGKKIDFYKADTEYKCELDGTCGTKDKGKGAASDAKQNTRDRLERELDEAKHALEKARLAAKIRSDESATRAAAADQVRLDETKMKLVKVKEEQDRIESSPVDDRPAARVGALMHLIGRETGWRLVCFAFFTLLCACIYVLPVMFTKDDLHLGRAARVLLREEIAGMREDASRDRGTSGLSRQLAENPKTGPGTSSRKNESNDGNGGPVGAKGGEPYGRFETRRRRKRSMGRRSHGD